jgi:hypothetical protein
MNVSNKPTTHSPPQEFDTGGGGRPRRRDRNGNGGLRLRAGTWLTPVRGPPTPQECRGWLELQRRAADHGEKPSNEHTRSI